MHHALTSVAGRKVGLWAGGSGPALLLLHSAWGDAEMSWSPVWDGLSRSFTVIAPDMPGFGASDPPAFRSLAGSASVLKALLDELAVGRAFVVGNSFGAALALEFASTYPERTTGVAAVNGTYLPFVPAAVRRFFALPAVEKRLRSFMRKMTYADQAFAKAFPHRELLPPDFLDRVRAFEERHAALVFDAFMNRERPQARPKVPASVIWGTGDRLVGRRQLDAFRTWLGDARFIPIEGAGHMPQIERPEGFIEAITLVGKG